MSHIPSPILLALSISCGYVFVKGLLCCAYDVCAWVLKNSEVEGHE
jgi:hypothetical protein